MVEIISIENLKTVQPVPAPPSNNDDDNNNISDGGNNQKLILFNLGNRFTF
jgi:hypothetical protein